MKHTYNHAGLMDSVTGAKSTGDMRLIAAKAMLAFARKEISSTEMNDATRGLKELTKKLNSSSRRNSTGSPS